LPGWATGVPTPVLVLEILGSAIAMAVLAMHLSTLGGPGVFTVRVAAPSSESSCSSRSTSTVQPEG